MHYEFNHSKGTYIDRQIMTSQHMSIQFSLMCLKRYTVYYIDSKLCTEPQSRHYECIYQYAVCCTMHTASYTFPPSFIVVTILFRQLNIHTAVKGSCTRKMKAIRDLLGTVWKATCGFCFHAHMEQ